MSGDRSFWEKHYREHGSANQSPFTEAKCKKILELIPNNVKTILDVGCGGGSLMLYLKKERDVEVEGVDRSASGVDHIVDNLGLKAQVGDVLDLKDIPSNAYDMVICSEVLEHIDVKYWKQALGELRRVSKKYVLTTNPYNEKLKYHHVICPHCRTRFHPVGHIHSVDEGFVDKNVRPFLENLEVHFSGSRYFTAIMYSDMMRIFGYQMVDTLDVRCPVCDSDVPFKKWSIPLKLINRGYLVSQVALGKLGVSGPATIICFAEV